MPTNWNRLIVFVNFDDAGKWIFDDTDKWWSDITQWQVHTTGLPFHTDNPVAKTKVAMNIPAVSNIFVKRKN